MMIVVIRMFAKVLHLQTLLVEPDALVNRRHRVRPDTDLVQMHRDPAHSMPVRLRLYHRHQLCVYFLFSLLMQFRGKRRVWLRDVSLIV